MAVVVRVDLVLFDRRVAVGSICTKRLQKFLGKRMTMPRKRDKHLMRCLMVLALAGSNQMMGVAASASTTVDSSIVTRSSDCKAIEICRLCTDSDKSNIGACKETGKVELFGCPVAKEGETGVAALDV